MLTIDNLILGRNGKNIMGNFGISIFPGTCLVVSGSNGSGKTTLLKHLVGINTYGSGRVYYNGVDISTCMDEYQSLVCYLGHQNALTPELTVRENLEFWARLHGRHETILAAAFTFSLVDVLSSPVRGLSQGWQRRVALARLLLGDASLWFLDEPYSNLDQDGCGRLDNMIVAKCQQNGIVVLTSHRASLNIGAINISLDGISSGLGVI